MLADVSNYKQTKLMLTDISKNYKETKLMLADLNNYKQAKN